MSIYKIEKEYLIRTYECDKNENLRLLTLMNIFQDVADTHASDMGLGLEYCLSKGLAGLDRTMNCRCCGCRKCMKK